MSQLVHRIQFTQIKLDVVATFWVHLFYSLRQNDYLVNKFLDITHWRTQVIMEAPSTLIIVVVIIIVIVVVVVIIVD